MRTKFFALLLFTSSSLVAGAHFFVGLGGGYPYGYGYAAPPPPPVATYYVPPRPYPGYSWIPGYYYPVGPRYSWRGGYWARPPYAGASWVGPRYYGGRYYNGYWRR